MNISKFYDFGSKLILATATFPPKNINFENDLFAERRLIRGDYEGFQFPIIYEYERGKNIKDILDTGFASLYLISDNFKAVLEKNHLTGWRSYPVRLFDKKGNEVSGYHGFSVTGRCDPIDYSRSEIIEKRRVPEGPVCKIYKGTFIDKWDGSDFFLPKDFIQIIINAKAAKVLKDNKITNLQLKNLAEEETSDYIVELVLKHRREDLANGKDS